MSQDKHSSLVYLPSCSPQAAPQWEARSVDGGCFDCVALRVYLAGQRAHSDDAAGV